MKLYKLPCEMFYLQHVNMSQFFLVAASSLEVRSVYVHVGNCKCCFQ